MSQFFYPAKLLLFGEYTVLNRSQALAVPLMQWKGEWIKGEKTAIQKDTVYYAYVDWLRENELISPSAIAMVIDDIKEGWIYQSTIPVGYGLGSSGALVAALYHRYLASETPPSNEVLLPILSKMESYFHGQSSGMDPLASYLKMGVYRDEVGNFQGIDDPGWPEGYRVFLLDSGVGRSTGPLVTAYKEQLKEEIFRLKIERELIPMVEHAIHFYLSGSAQMLEQSLSSISQFQREYFSMYIPEQVKKQWDELMTKPGIYVKFCGAGGGGYFLVISTEGDELKSFDTLIRIF